MRLGLLVALGLAALFALLSGCASLPPNFVERAACVAQGGTWTDAGGCKLPAPPPPPVVEPPPPVVEPPPVVVPPPVPVPVPTPNPTPTPAPNPTGCRYPAAEALLVSVPDATASRLEVVKAGERALGDLRRPGGGTPLSRHNNRLLAAWLRGSGYCAFAGQEAIFILNAAGLWEEYHASAETDGGWTQVPYRGNHKLEGPTVADPIDEPEIVAADGCGTPDPPPFDHFNTHRTDIRDGWEKYDVTPLTSEGNLSYCTSVGFVGRGSCPARAEEPAWMGGDRLACERRWLKGLAPFFNWTGSERDGGPRADNPFGFERRKGSAGSLSVCLADRTSCQVIL
jgi:hypothetical protein